ncbi:NrsF family protein [Burkholderia glumae]|uniref:DUF1109 domain-containing protein n=1 Tax=Burkholderia glumae TaxID=337 RepID=A0AAP9Y5N9_BURGL|nr:NrsF family protein [Burkholderia glumae]ACR32745.1 Amino acid transporter [Burkholderia glumae BGR1]AJY62296.1 hypothetical protein KS03_5843 [Burkholderia glumae LMG 2196 = ATCC 33617]MCM2485760.1 DUF1109 domain-containing protein [Burkholderia glumae]MCM2511598.1 DUF1109 domain-containing protein [Burkholderia glumae]MCM2541691.1 DUF1109 domain-containing protein [Burkholderia glumae]
MDTHTLIDALVADLRPVRRLSPPALRLLGWLVVSVPAVAAIVALEGVRSDITAQLAEPSFLIEQVTTVATALVAGWAALAGCIPGTARWKLWLPVAPLSVWIASLGHQCWSEWILVGASGMSLRPDWMCLPNIAVIGALPAIAIVIAIRRGARLDATPVLWGSLAAAALADAALRLIHAEDAALMVIVWQFGSVALFTTALTLFRRFLVPIRTARMLS